MDKTYSIVGGRVNRLDDNNYEIILFTTSEQIKDQKPGLILRLSKTNAVMMAQEICNKLTPSDIDPFCK